MTNDVYFLILHNAWLQIVVPFRSTIRSNILHSDRNWYSLIGSSTSFKKGIVLKFAGSENNNHGNAEINRQPSNQPVT